MKTDNFALKFCADFLQCDQSLRFVLGRNLYSKAIISALPISAIIDDYTSESDFHGVPIIRSGDIPKNALVLNASGGKTLSSKRRLDSIGVENLDYFAFLKYSGISLPDIVFNEGFAADFNANRTKYQWVSGLLKDDLSREVFSKLVSFRASLDISELDGFSDNEDQQYFEDFLALGCVSESFVDVGCFDGRDTRQFISRVESYREVNAFEPDPENYSKCVRALSPLPRVSVHQIALGQSGGISRLKVNGSGSRVDAAGSVKTSVARFDDLKISEPTFIKIDIEGAEQAALWGSRESICRWAPRLAVAVYHKVGDFYRIPEMVLSIQPEYDIRLRHYTETLYETVMFFTPRWSR
jgi:FkbM family methyltransferase